MTRTLKQLQDSVQRLIEQQGENAPVAAWIFTNEDVSSVDDDNLKIQPLDVAEKVLGNLDDYGYIYEVIFDSIENELRKLGIQE